MSTNSRPVSVLLGVDSEHYPNALALLKAMRLSTFEVHLLNVVESLLPDGSYPDLADGHPLTIMLENREEEGRGELERAARMLAGTCEVHCHQEKGSPARLLIEMADRIRADLICAGSAQKGQWGSLFFGSVTKALSAEATQSILIGKAAPSNPDSLRVVIATDLSDYATRCIRQFLDWKPQAVSRTTLVTALPHVGADAEEAADSLKSLSDELAAAGLGNAYVVAPGSPQEVIAEVMADTNADLLIMGARGHGFWKRVWLGSVAHHQVVATPHNVLVLRVRGD